ncbi:hypothetical protein [Bacillus sp. T3]|uniref:hypothetical protein n=1 Tax=Bacillus sp. T3 TaxID=467262 RepID=UPI0029817C29|nr:hypothetical protein [Bacillus sp. T3]
MKLFMLLQRKVPSETNSSEGKEAQELIRKVPPRVKVMTSFRTTEKVKSEARRQSIQGGLVPKQGRRVASLIRIQMEEVKRKVRVCSPQAKQFIGPGDYDRNIIKKGGIHEHMAF